MSESTDDPKAAAASSAPPDEPKPNEAVPGDAVDVAREQTAVGADEASAGEGAPTDATASNDTEAAGDSNAAVEPQAAEKRNAKGEQPVKSTAPAGETLVEPNAYHVQLPEFEGPLDLLLHLIQKHELDILDIPIGFIAKKYVEYLNLMDALSIDVASEYLVMAATLAHIKSKSLLPPDPNAEEDELTEEEEDPRTELIRRLLEYQKYKQAAEQLGGRSVLGRDVFARGIPIEASTEPAPLAQLSLFKLVDAFEEVLKRAKQVEDHQIDFERISITEKIGQISELLRSRGRLEFVDLFPAEITRIEMIITFLALLEMTKLRMTFIQQDDPMGPIFVELRVTDDDDPFALGSGELSDESAEAESQEDDVLAQQRRRAQDESWTDSDEEDSDEEDSDEEDSDEEDSDEEDSDEEDSDEEDSDEEDERSEPGAGGAAAAPALDVEGERGAGVLGDADSNSTDAPVEPEGAFALDRVEDVSERETEQGDDARDSRPKRTLERENDVQAAFADESERMGALSESVIPEAVGANQRLEQDLEAVDARASAEPGSERMTEGQPSNATSELGGDGSEPEPESVSAELPADAEEAMETIAEPVEHGGLLDDEVVEGATAGERRAPSSPTNHDANE